MTTKPSGPSWGLIAALALLICCVSFLGYAISLFADPLSAQAFAAAEASKHGWQDYNVLANDYGGGEFRFVFESPNRDHFADMTIRKQGDAWTVVKLNKDFRPWPDPDWLSH